MSKGLGHFFCVNCEFLLSLLAFSYEENIEEKIIPFYSQKDGSYQSGNEIRPSECSVSYEI